MPRNIDFEDLSAEERRAVVEVLQLVLYAVFADDDSSIEDD